ncbi:golgin subfamily A member 6-like protein 1 [Bombus vosnesenskii]|uniref:Golgin subfamily A member 6-like protein 1 n=1 Tax=Bombus vosnesenskii TaxID=207650 RepID=A0A6J3L355_9HYME|nr:golgin subfamily A member 6-like protein 1 [Bombus vosnesenskii]
MSKRLKKFLKEADLELSTEKTKIVVFKKRRNKRRQRKWKWGEQELEEMDEIRYLGYILQKNGSDKKHIQNRKKRATIAMKKTWNVGERIFKQDYKRRMKMFGALVESVALFGAEVWSWNMEERLDRVQRGYVKWILGLDMTTLNYILVEEWKLIEMKEKALKRAARFEEKALESKKELVKECIKEKERENGGVVQEGKRARKRKKGLEEVRKGGTQIETGEEQERMTTDQIIEERRKRETEERGERIRESKYNIHYRNIAKEKLPKYLEGRMKWKDRRIRASFRCGNETKAREYWK